MYEIDYISSGVFERSMATYRLAPDELVGIKVDIGLDPTAHVLKQIFDVSRAGEKLGIYRFYFDRIRLGRRYKMYVDYLWLGFDWPIALLDICSASSELENSFVKIDEQCIEEYKQMIREIS